ncbi:TonB-dependent receptor [Luteibacter rhizovicinus]|uniref:TonB-dependent receptor n=1 Tax=Luteibacter rhizovicinus TaxID=242606 RepID=A0A4R3YQR2_9GAMM|nr:TonB-dependent receptor [Luteibacter rhizovicinus]TCV94692.1 TonB-dependent receptor [Luteibacter rhizovicinus]
MQRKILALSVRNALVAVMSAACVIGYTNAHAQDAPAGPAKSDTASASSPTGEQDASTKADAKKVTDLNAIAVTGQIGSLYRSQLTKQDSNGIVDSVSAEEAGKFPDQNVADALQRVPGVSVNRSGGESNQITVRGFGPTFVNVLLNGRTMASASSDRAFNFDVLPSEVIQQAVVQKTSSADVDAGGIGGTVNILTARPLDFNGFHMTGSAAGVNDNIGGGLSSKTTPKVSGMIGDSNKDHTFAWLASFVYYKRDHVQQSVDTLGWLTNQDFSRINPSYTNIALPQTLQGQVTTETRTRKSFNGAIDWIPFDNLTVKLDGLVSEYKIDSKYNAFGLFTNTGVIQSITPNANGTAQHFTENGSGGMSNDYAEQSNPRDAMNEQFGANISYKINDSTQIDWDTAVSKAWNKQSANGYFVVLGTRNIGVNPSWTNNGANNLPSYTGNLSPTDINTLYAHVPNTGTQSPNVSDSILQNRLHLSKTFLDGTLSQLDFGIERSDQSKTQVTYSQPGSFGCSEYCGYVVPVPASAVDAHIYNAGSLVNGASPGFPQQWVAYDVNKLFAYLATPAAYNQLPNPEAFKAILDANGGFGARPDPNTYSRIRERIESAYAMANLQGDWANMPWNLNLGARYTKTSTTSSAYSAPIVGIAVNPNDPTNAIPTYGPLQPISRKGSYFNWLPSAAFKLNLRDDLIFRLAASKTLTRPDLGNLSAAVSYNFRPQNQTVEQGNTGLNPYTSKNLDTGLEWYFSDTSYIALDAFYKKVSNFSTLITRSTSILGFPFQLTEPVNLNSAVIKGAEFTFNYQFKQLPSPFDGLGITTNYTYVTSDASISPNIISTSGKFAVPGIGDSANGTIYYQKGPLELRLAYNWRDKYLASIAGGQGQPTTVKSYGQLDFSANYKINDHVSIFLDETNLTNETISQYQVYLDRESYAEANGRTLFMGIRGSW